MSVTPPSSASTLVGRAEGVGVLNPSKPLRLAADTSCSNNFDLVFANSLNLFKRSSVLA